MSEKKKINKKASAFVSSGTKKHKAALTVLLTANAIGSVCVVFIALFAKYIIDAALAKDLECFSKYLIGLAIIFAAEILLKVLTQRITTVLQGKLEIYYKSRVFSSILSRDYSAVNAYHSGELLNRLTSDVKVVSDGITNVLPNVASMLAKLIGAVAVMLYLDKTFVGLLLLAGVFCIGATQIFRKQLKTRHKDVQQSDGVLRSFLQEGLESLLVIKVFGAHDLISDKANGFQNENYKKKLKKNTITILATTGLGVFFVAGYACALAWCAVKLFKGEITAGTLTAMLQLVSQVQTPITLLAAIIPQYFSILASGERLVEIEDIKPEQARNTENVDAKALYKNLKNICFENVTFSYDRDTVIENSNLVINKGDFVAITGISGIGKSTLFKILLGVLSPDEGEVFLRADKNYYSDVKTRKLFSYVPQGNMLFSGTIRENISFINPEATDDEIMEAAKTACAAEFINELPQGLDTVIGEKGHGLSEGQVQRLAVARAVLCNAPIVLLDEATSALDEDTEEKLLNNIRSIPNTTCIIISHKSAAKKICNREIRIENKEILTVK